jgi:hypothetical protein
MVIGPVQTQRQDVDDPRDVQALATAADGCPFYVASVRQMIISAGWREKR